MAGMQFKHSGGIFFTCVHYTRHIVHSIFSNMYSIFSAYIEQVYSRV